MRDATYDVVTIGGGPAGMAAALAARQAGADRVLIIERDRELGGILQQCIHNGFGLRKFKEELTGPGYADRYIEMVGAAGIDVWLDSTVLAAEAGGRITCVGPTTGLATVEAKAVVHSMGCRERTRGAIRIPGSRPAGVFTAGAAQRMVNMEGYLPGRDVVIIGSGDIGLIMARRMTLEGARVRAVFEIMPYSNGLTRNIVQCLEDFGIPLYLSHCVVAVHGHDRVTGVTVAEVDADLHVKPGTEFDLPCDCVLLSVGLIPENELGRAIGVSTDRITSGAVVDQFRQTSKPGFFAAGNVLHVHDLVDLVSNEAEIAGRSAALFAKGVFGEATHERAVIAGEGLRQVVPQRLSTLEKGKNAIRFFFRSKAPMGPSIIALKTEDGIVWDRKLRVVKPSEMIVADIPVNRFAKASHIEFVLTLDEHPEPLEGAVEEEDA
ncbi:FAD-dependent oxidoreductase [Siculibacillus lacustris]|uniref:FAD-dependent oxidoreductase n=1 Tax=Siculibacillus lacustris TaxID=1549641 RepID=A0A4Q9VK74_9HYPH|nr:FAD-dependent oxidoreductase [Siculibacillus lacustris]TBW34879.1 FAD-dependent oxidoreductase [Siculibacillus lacustris]